MADQPAVAYEMECMAAGAACIANSVMQYHSHLPMLRLYCAGLTCCPKASSSPDRAEARVCWIDVQSLPSHTLACSAQQTDKLPGVLWRDMLVSGHLMYCYTFAGK